MVAVLVVAGVVAVVAALVGGGRPRAIDQQAPGPVLLVPGYGGSTGSLTTLASALRGKGKDVTIVPLPGDATGDLNAQAQALGRAADAVLRRTHARSVDVVGYSAGGVVARLWVRDHGGGSVVRRVVTLGSPHHGTELAGLGSLVPGACPTACRQLEPDSDLLAALNRGGATGGPTFVSIWTTHDDVVIPPDSARLAGALNLVVQTVCAEDQVTHGGLPRDRVVVEMVTAELAAGQPVPLTATDCPRLSS